MAALLAIVMLGGCTGTGAGGTDDSNAGRSRTRAKKNSSSKHDRLIGFSYSPGYSDMMGAYYAEEIIRAEDGTYTYVVTAGDAENTVTHYNVSIGQRYDTVERNDSGSHFYHPYDVLNSTDPFLPDAMARALNDLASQYETESADMCAKAERESEENEGFYAYAGDDCTLFRADSRVLSFARKRDTHNNGSAAFANVRDKSFTTYNFDPESGRQIPLTDVVLDIDAFSKLAAGQLYERYVEGSPNPMAKDLFESKEKLADDIRQILTGNPEHPVYTLKDDDTGYNLADLYYLEGVYMPDDYRMMITFHFSEGDVSAVFYQPKG